MYTDDVLTLLEEIIEKVWRLETFLSEIELISVDQDKKLIQFYKSQIDGLKDLLQDPINEIVLEKADSDRFPDILDTYFGACSYFQIMHQQFQLFVSLPKICPEVYTFVDSLFPVGKFETVEPTLVYCSIYNFGEVNTIERFYRLKILLGKEFQDRVVLLLPYADFRNPMMWTALAHEMGHAIEKDRKLVSSVLTESAEKKELETLRNWLREACADYIALKLMGPAYLTSFISYTTSIHPINFTSSFTHPQPHIRIKYMRSYLEENNLFTSTSQKYIKLFESLTDFYGVSEEESLLIGEFSNLTKKLNIKTDTVIVDFPEKCIPETIVKADELADNLDNGIFISSSRDRKMEQIQKDLDKFLAEESPGKTEQKKVYSILRMIEDRPSTIPQIINAGLVQKVNKHVVSLKKCFEKDNSFNENFSAFGKYLEAIDYNIKKSIETSKFHSRFCQERNNDT